MKKQLLISLVGIVILVSVSQVGIISALAVSSPQKSQLDSPIHRAGTIPTVLVTNASATTVHVGDAITANMTLINKNTGAGIPDATLSIQFSLDGNQWTTLASAKTDSNGSINRTMTIPDPRSYGIQLPLTVYVKVVFAGDQTYAATERASSVTVLPP